MTSVLDLGILDQFSFVFVIILVYAILLGVLMMGKMFNPVINNIIAITAALMMLLVPGLIEVFKIVLPWSTVFILLGLVGMLLSKMFGVTDPEITETFKHF